MKKTQLLYLDQDGFLITVATGWCQRVWATYRVKETFLQRVNAKDLPARGSFEEAQADLDLYAPKQGWELHQILNKIKTQEKGADFGKSGCFPAS